MPNWNMYKINKIISMSAEEKKNLPENEKQMLDDWWAENCQYIDKLLHFTKDIAFEIKCNDQIEEIFRKVNDK